LRNRSPLPADSSQDRALRRRDECALAILAGWFAESKILAWFDSTGEVFWRAGAARELVIVAAFLLAANREDASAHHVGEAMRDTGRMARLRDERQPRGQRQRRRAPARAYPSAVERFARISSIIARVAYGGWSGLTHSQGGQSKRDTPIIGKALRLSRRDRRRQVKKEINRI
jgi:hypothetical protein